jgi:hypothetical protein
MSKPVILKISKIDYKFLKSHYYQIFLRNSHNKILERVYELFENKYIRDSGIDGMNKKNRNIINYDYLMFLSNLNGLKVAKFDDKFKEGISISSVPHESESVFYIVNLEFDNFISIDIENIKRVNLLEYLKKNLKNESIENIKKNLIVQLKRFEFTIGRKEYGKFFNVDFKNMNIVIKAKINYLIKKYNLHDYITNCSFLTTSDLKKTLTFSFDEFEEFLVSISKFSNELDVVLFEAV